MEVKGLKKIAKAQVAERQMAVPVVAWPQVQRQMSGQEVGACHASVRPDWYRWRGAFEAPLNGAKPTIIKTAPKPTRALKPDPLGRLGS